MQELHLPWQYQSFCPAACCSLSDSSLRDPPNASLLLNAIRYFDRRRAKALSNARTTSSSKYVSILCPTRYLAGCTHSVAVFVPYFLQTGLQSVVASASALLRVHHHVLTPQLPKP